MKEFILNSSSDIFLKYGFKSVTMDHLSSELNISKKTIYKYYENKEELVDKTVILLQEKFHKTVLNNIDKGYNAIQENFETIKSLLGIFETYENSSIHELKKYYPKTFHKIKSLEFLMLKDFISKNIIKGINEGLYREDIDDELLAKFYFLLLMRLYSPTPSIYSENNISTLERNVLEYHIRAISTLKGLKILEGQLEKI